MVVLWKINESNILHVTNINRTIFEPDRDKVNIALILYNNLSNTSMQDKIIFIDYSKGLCQEPVLLDCSQDIFTHSVSFSKGIWFYFLLDKEYSEIPKLYRM